MQLKIQTNRAICMMLYLSEQGAASLSELASALSLDRDSVRKLVAPLRAHGWITCERTPSDQVRLEVEPEQISLLDIMEVTEGTMKISRCLEEIPEQDQSTEAQAVRRIYEGCQELTERFFSSITLQDLARSCG